MDYTSGKEEMYYMVKYLGNREILPNVKKDINVNYIQKNNQL